MQPGDLPHPPGEIPITPDGWHRFIQTQCGSFVASPARPEWVIDGITLADSSDHLKRTIDTQFYRHRNLKERHLVNSNIGLGVKDYLVTGDQQQKNEVLRIAALTSLGFNKIENYT